MRILSLLLAALPFVAYSANHDTIIRHGRIIDGTGNGWYYGDVAIDEGRISVIGDLAGDSATHELDATGLVVAPGFIDVHTHADEDLYDRPIAENFIRDGVTTIVTGNCGGSVTDVAKYFNRLTKDGISVNTATLYGHNTILRETKGNKKGELTAEQWTEAEHLMRKAMEDGAVGLSTGLIYTPGQWSDTEEIIRLQAIAAEYGGIYASHMRSEGGGIVKAIEEALRIGRETDSRVEISHFKLPKTAAARVGGSDATLKMIVDARASGQEVWSDQYPYTASSTTISVMLPDWVLEGGPAKAKEILKDETQLQRVYTDMANSNERTNQREDMAYAVVASASGFSQYAGKSILQIAQEKKAEAEDSSPVTMLDQYKAIVDIYLKGGAGMIFHTMDESDVENIMRAPFISVCSDSGVRKFGSGMPHPRGYGSNARVLGEYVRKRNVIPLEDAIRKMTSLPATAFRFYDRGMIADGKWADIVVFDPATVTDNATFADPHHYSTGFKYVLVNGEVVVENDESTGALPGMVIYGPGKKKERLPVVRRGGA